MAGVAVSLSAAFFGWMVAQVAEHPGVAREVGELPPWFAGALATPRARALPPLEARGQSVAAPAADKAAAAEGGYADFASGPVEIVFREYRIAPSKIRVGPGKVSFVLRNEGRVAHDFRVEGPGTDITTQKFGPGRTVRIELALREGEYKISCPLSNHDERGMHGTLVVTAQLARR